MNSTFLQNLTFLSVLSQVDATPFHNPFVWIRPLKIQNSEREFHKTLSFIQTYTIKLSFYFHLITNLKLALPFLPRFFVLCTFVLWSRKNNQSDRITPLTLTVVSLCPNNPVREYYTKLKLSQLLSSLKRRVFY